MTAKRLYPLTGTITIGRGEHNTIVLPDATVSRVHAIVRGENGSWILEDLGSANGVMSKGKKVTNTVLRLGDCFQIGSTSFELCGHDVSQNNTCSSQTGRESRTSVIETLEECFDATGVIDRETFLRNTRILAPHHERIFYLLLQRLKGDTKKESRLAILEALPVLYDNVPGARMAVQILLNEFCTPAEHIQHYDRNLIMLAIKLVRHFRKEDGKKIEQTPGEVLRVQHGLHNDTVKLAQQVVSNLNNQIINKRATLHISLIKSLSDKSDTESTGFSPRFLFSLLREFYILMGLIGGSEAKEIVCEGALAVSTPQSKLYHQPLSKTYSEHILGLLRVIVQSCLRLLTSDGDDPHKLKMLEARLLALLSSVQDASQQVHLREVARLVQEHL
jgi:pSer/pThr/pTyr-binding forkhead associated (FHA) protein